jgi:hypothetical protein
MNLAAIIRRGVGILDKNTQSLQAVVTYEPWLGQDDYGNEEFGPVVSMNAIVDNSMRDRPSSTGQLVVSRAKVTFPRPISVDTRDRIILPDGTTGPIIDVMGVVDRATGKPYATDVLLGFGQGAAGR